MFKQIIDKCKKNKNVYVFKDMFKFTPTWQDFINHLNFAFKDKNFKGGNEGSKEIVNGVNFWQKLTLTVENPSIEYYKYLNEYINKFKEIHSNRYQNSFVVISFTDAEPTTSRHCDPVDVFYLQGVGSVVWSIYKNDIIEEHILNPGDVIFVPSGIDHEIMSLSPRAAISFMFESGEQNA